MKEFNSLFKNTRDFVVYYFIQIRGMDEGQDYDIVFKAFTNVNPKLITYSKDLDKYTFSDSQAMDISQEIVKLRR